MWWCYLAVPVNSSLQPYNHNTHLVVRTCPVPTIYVDDMLSDFLHEYKDIHCEVAGSATDVYVLIRMDCQKIGVNCVMTMSDHGE